MSSITLNTNHGAITISLNSEKAPETVANFLSYAKDGFFEGTIFHRVIKGFMIQGGGFTADMDQKDTKAPIKNEANNGLVNKKGSIAMARTQDPHSATAQFFINAKDNDFLNHTSESVSGWGYCVFGEVTAGIEVVEAIEAVATGNSGFHADVPLETVMIESVDINE
ncbi:MAG: peptidylprolyl isomerase [Glaciecola sp.]|jgi:peptidyl-prolyl cis-trans isomerase B (cyclophilin B)|uniref:peptidylprolyl isomerase n=1 Tax=Glaciecola sp. HTCC2999 TaxID=455436 RepID=UPI0000E0E892|nr:peptidylprolyl isomerase [Glaciecola sp. HTCC2999]MCH1414812.1 peptidyl-prolyl cis-trans isomerase [Glaciecola sp.]